MDFDLPEEPAAPVQAASGGIKAVTVATLESLGGWPEILGRVLSRQDLTADEASAALDDVALRRGQPDRVIKMKLDRVTWLARRRTDIEIEGLDGCLDMFGR